MSVEIIQCEQNTDEWMRARMGLPTSSMFGTVMAKGRGADKESKTRAKYLRQLAGEIITGEPTEGFRSAVLDRGHASRCSCCVNLRFQSNAALLYGR